MEKLPVGLFAPTPETLTEDVDGKWLLVELEPGCHTTLDLGMKRFVDDPSYEEPWNELQR